MWVKVMSQSLTAYVQNSAHPHCGFSNGSSYSYDIIVASITQYTQLRNKNSKTQGSSPNMVKLISIPNGTALKGKNSLPLVANSFL